MRTTDNYRPGLRPTTRQLMILSLFVACISAQVAPYFRESKPPSFQDKAAVAVALSAESCFVLPVLIMLLDRRGPAKNWYALVIFWTFMMATLAIGLWLLLYSGVLPRPWFFTKPLEFIFPALFVAGAARLTFDLMPALCPCCGQRALVPVQPGSSRWMPQTRSCAVCGRRSCKSRRGAWQPL